MSIEIDTLAALSTRESYFRFSGMVLSKGSILSRETALIIKDMKEFYNKYEGDLNWLTFGQWFLQLKHPRVKDDEAKLYKKMFDRLHSQSELTVMQKEIVASLIERSFADQVAVLTGRVSEGDDRVTLADVRPIMDEWESTLKAEEIESDSWDMEAVTFESGYNWRMAELNDSAGPARKSNLILFAARPGVGKTTMMTSEVGYMINQIERVTGSATRPLVAIHNEEGPVEVLQIRWMQSLLGWTVPQILTDKKAAVYALNKFLGSTDRLIIRHMPSASITEIEAEFVKYNPALIVVDQVRLAKGFESAGTEVERLKEVYRWARLQASIYGPFFTVHQAGDAADGKLFPAGNMLEGCKTEIQGALDLQVMIGATHNGGNQRGLNIVKNKMMGTMESRPELREANWTVQIESEIARYRGRPT